MENKGCAFNNSSNIGNTEIIFERNRLYNGFSGGEHLCSAMDCSHRRECIV